MLDPIFDLLAGLLAWFYDQVPSFGFAIIALTVLVLLVLSPLTYKSTKSMVSMRRLQPQVRRLQKKYKSDRETLNKEMMALYQEHQVSPVSGCLPILIQSPVFIVMFRVIRGITRRSADIGASAGDILPAAVDARTAGANFTYENFDLPARNFNPEYLSETSAMYQDLSKTNEMLWLGLDLSRTPLEALRDSIGAAMPYLAMVALVAFLSWYQQRQIQGRMTGEVSSQQQMIMRFLPWMLPVFSFTMPAGLVLYFIVSALLRIAQQAYLTRTIYNDESLTAPIEVDDDDDFEDDGEEPENPLAALFNGGQRDKKTAAPAQPSERHGARRPTSGSSPRKRTRPPRETTTPTAKTPSKRSKAASADAAKEKTTGWNRAKRSAAPEEAPAKPVSRRVTPKGDSTPGRRKK